MISRTLWKWAANASLDERATVADDAAMSSEDSDPPRGPINEPVEHTSVSARVPTHIGRGVLSTGVMVFEGPSEFVLDFVLRLAQPHAIVARIVLSHLVCGQLIAALRENLKAYQARFGPPPSLPVPPPEAAAPHSITDIYESLKLPEELMSGVYANAVMIGHSPGEFWFDFITNFYPRAAVSSRVYMTAQHVPGMLETLITSYQAHQRRLGGGPPPS